MRSCRPVLLSLALAACTPAAPSDAQAPEPAAGGLSLAFPLACEIGASCEVQNYVDRDPGPGMADYHCGRRTYDGHDGVDIRLPDMAAQRAGVDVLAAAAGRVARLRDGVQDISIRAAGAPKVEGQECGNGVVIDHGNGWETQYCHLARGSLRVKAGDQVAAGQPIAQAGLSGNTEFPHLHLSVRRARGGLWDAAAAKAMAYKRGVVLNAGFAAGPVSLEAVEAGSGSAPGAEAPALVAFVRAIGLEGGDQLELVLQGPAGQVLAQNRATLDRDKAQWMIFTGARRPPAGWPHGTYAAKYGVRRAGKSVLAHEAEITM